MIARLILVSACLALAACGDPLDRVDRFADVQVDRDAAIVEALPGPGEVEGEPGVIGRWIRNERTLARQPADTEITEVRPTDITPTQEDTNRAVRANTRRGLFARRGAPAGLEVELPAGSTPEFGQMALACAARGAALGTEIDRFPKTGRGYKLYDSQPGATGARLFYVTGFADGCPRKFTAALAMFGAPAMYESLRYVLPKEARTDASTDKAYETIKARVCRVRQGEPCGRRMPRLERDTVFISAYERLGANSRWADMLLHDGTLHAKALKTKGS